MKKSVFSFFFLLAAMILSAQEAELPVLTFEEALQRAITSSYTVQLKQAAVLAARARLKSAKAGTDITVGASGTYTKQHTPYDDDPYYGGNGIDDIESSQISSSLWLQKAFSFGLQSRLSLGIASTLSNYHGNDAVEKYYEQTYGTDYYNRGTTELAFSLPLFKSFNASVTANNIKAAEAYYRQLEYELTDSICQTLLSCASAYWAYLTAHSNLRQLEEMQQALQKRSDSMERLIQAGLQSKTDLLAMQVSLIENERNITKAQINYKQSLLSLMQTLGMDTEKESIGNPNYTFPALDFSNLTLPSEADIDSAFLSRVYADRADFQALKKQVEAAEASLRAAIAESRPDAAINFAVGSTGAVYGDSLSDFIHSFSENVPGSNISGGISFSMAIPNNGRKASVESAQASYKQAQVQFLNAKNTLSLQLKNAVSQLNSWHKHVVNAKNALELQQQLYENEQRRFSSGLITVNDMSNQDSKYLDAQIQYYQIMIDYFRSVLEYKYYTGTLAEVTDGSENILNSEKLYAIEP